MMFSAKVTWTMVQTAAYRVVTLAGSMLLAACTSTPADDAGNGPIAGTVHLCSSCHGLDGRSVSPTFPRLAGQQQDYLEAQLHNFRDKTRADPHAHTYMWGMAAHLSDETIAGVARYYAALPPATGGGGDPTLVAEGKAIFRDGVEARGIPACQGCHGENAEGQGPIPRLAGQHFDYLKEQLAAFASNQRANETMHENSLPMTGHDIEAVATFLAGQ
jgi:cytochrome c553